MPRPLPLLIVSAILVGCSDPDPVRQYTVAKPTPDDTFTPGPDAPAAREQPQQRRLAWFFKLVGPDAAVAGQAEPFAKLVRSVQFGPDGRPRWTLPEGWTERESSGVRMATIEIPGEPKLEIGVTNLPTVDVLDNLNRWRDQLGLEAVQGDAGLQASRDRGELQQFDAKDRKTALVNLAGKTAESGDSRMLAAMIVPGAQATVASSAPPAPDDGKPFTFTRPEGWKEAPLRTFQLAAFTVGEEDKPLTISISTAGGDVTANVNRWRGQASLPEMTEKEVNDSARTIAVDGIDAMYFVVEGEERAILGVIAPRPGTQWFIKADGPKSLAQQEREKFEAFVKSIRFK